MQKITHRTPSKTRKPKPPFPGQKQKSPGLEWKINPRPQFAAREGADIAITFLPEEIEDAKETKEYVEALGRVCTLIQGDLTKESFCIKAVEKTASTLGGIDILVSNAAHQMRKNSLDEISTKEWDRTFKINIYAYFFLAKAAIQHMQPGSAIIATSSEPAMRVPKELPDYSATKGSINTFTKSLAQMLIEKKIRVNAVAPGPVWTPLNVSDEGIKASKVKQFGNKQPIKRPAQPKKLHQLMCF